ncbi:MAG TPA: GntG family PLP-dependent aldolase [Bacteroidota bacterium]|nr:GntG family PLP-dependent aldolase [Bacteroidota bacterium]
MKKSGIIDLRSDTVTKPGADMRRAMAEAEVGDDVYGEDPTVNRLQETVAEILGKEAALFTPSGVMANELAIKAHTQPGDEVIVEGDSHIFNYETAGPAMLSHVQLRTLKGVRGILRVEDLLPAVRSREYHLPRTSLVCIENTHNRAGGSIYPLEEMRRIRTFTRRANLALHLDGARLWNASAATGIKPETYAATCDSVSVCFSKGLGAPVGSALAGTKGFIDRARRLRKVFGGGMRQGGIIAAGALFALEHNRARLGEDHEKARTFVRLVSGVRGFNVDEKGVETNIVVIDISGRDERADSILTRLRRRGVLLSEMSPTLIRAVAHLDVSAQEVERAGEIVSEALS